MDLDEFHDEIEMRLPEGVDVEPDDAARAVLSALAHRLTADEAAELAEQLPDGLGEPLASATGERPFERDGFIEDVASRLDVDDVDGERVALAVLGAIRSALEPGVGSEQVMESLPSDLALLMHAVE